MTIRDEPREGLRARKRREVRARISDTATRLFLERGFDAVSVDEVASVADVSRATVFNYFECKEDLLLDRAPELLEIVRRAVSGAPRGQTLAAVRGALLTLVDSGDPLSGSVPAIKWFWPLVNSTPSLRARAQERGDELEVELGRMLRTRGFGQDSGLIAALAWAAWWYAWREAVGKVQAGAAVAAVRTAQRKSIERAFAGIIGGFAPSLRTTK